MTDTERMRMLKTASGKDLPPADVLEILDAFMNDLVLYNPEINIANMKSSKPAKADFMFSPDIFAKTFTRSNYDYADFQRLMTENNFISTAIAAFDEEDTKRISVATVMREPDEVSIIFNVFDDRNVPDLEALLDRIS